RVLFRSVMIIMMTFVLPTFETMFKDLGAGSLPGPTRVVLAISHFITGNALILIPLVIAAGFGLSAFKKTERGRYLWDSMMLKLPVLGNVVRKGAVARFTRTLGTLLASGVPILDAMDIVARTAGNAVIQKGI